MDPGICDDCLENVWLADESQCDIVICVTEKAGVAPPIKQRIFAMSARGDSDTQCESCVVQRGGMVKVHAVSKQLVASPYFESYLKESWSKQNETERSLPLETCLASPQAYKRCMQLLCSSEPCSAHMFASPSEALDIYLASDHLLFKELNAVCMDYLASAQWSNVERKVLFEIFSTSDMKPSKDMAARLGLSKEGLAKNLSARLWDSFRDIYEKDGYGNSREPKLNRLYRVLSNILKQHGMKDSMTSSRKAIIEFVYRAMDFCFEKMKISRKFSPDWWLADDYFLGWLQMMWLSVEATDGKKSVESMACCDEVLGDLILHSNEVFLVKYFQYRGNPKQANDLDPSLRGKRVIEKTVKLVAECFKRVAEAEIIVPQSTRNSLIKCWVPWFEAIHRDGEICGTVDMPTLRAHVKEILQTLSMDDECILRILIEGAIRGEYLMEGALEAWCERLD